MGKILFLLWSIVLMSACDEKKIEIELVGNKQKLNLNNKDAKGNKVEAIRLVAHIPAPVYAGEEAVFKLTISKSEYKIVKAYIACPVDTSSLIDTVSYLLNGCNKELAVIRDTIVIALKPQKTGEYIFPETIVSISKGENGILRYHIGTFSYKVDAK